MKLMFFCLATILLLSRPLFADDPAAKAKALYGEGMVHYQLEEYDKAIDKWQNGFRVRPVPEFLYNIAQAYRLSKRPEKALTYYQKYLSMDPSSPNRDDVERHIRELRQAIDQHSAASTPALTTVPPPSPSESPPSPSEPPAGNLVAAAPPRATRPVYKKAWFWGTIGGAAVVVAGGITLGVLLGRDSAKSLPDVTF